MFYMTFLIKSSQKTQKVEIFIIPIIKIKKLMVRTAIKIVKSK